MNHTPSRQRDAGLDLEARLVALEREVAALRAAWAARPGMLYRGVYAPDVDYEQGDAVTAAGSLWIASAATRSRPPGEAWTLAVKRGRDGRDRHGVWSNDQED